MTLERIREQINQISCDLEALEYEESHDDCMLSYDDYEILVTSMTRKLESLYSTKEVLRHEQLYDIVGF